MKYFQFKSQVFKAFFKDSGRSLDHRHQPLSLPPSADPLDAHTQDPAQPAWGAGGHTTEPLHPIQLLLLPGDQPEQVTGRPQVLPQAPGHTVPSWGGVAWQHAQRVGRQAQTWWGEPTRAQAGCGGRGSPPWPRVRSSRAQAHSCMSSILGRCFMVLSNTSTSSAGHGRPGWGQEQGRGGAWARAPAGSRALGDRAPPVRYAVAGFLSQQLYKVSPPGDRREPRWCDSRAPAPLAVAALRGDVRSALDCRLSGRGPVPSTVVGEQAVAAGSRPSCAPSNCRPLSQPVSL